MDAKDAAECSREVAGVLAKFADAGGKGDTDRSTKLIMSCPASQKKNFHSPGCATFDQKPAVQKAYS